MSLCIIGLLSLTSFRQDMPVVILKEATVHLKNDSRPGKELKIYPNPVIDNQFRINLGTRYTGAVEILVFSSTGKVAHQDRLQNTGEQVVQVTMPAKLAGGVYTVHAVMGDTVLKGRLIASN
ncbi:T9SS type A sorting domain-containing protein [Paraflavitalea pollutisoli]|uniref:T9SS type A sorting domain-containing protein n=1 Tax=Paraflavitalea pollutisoli TaxID=3034143 RepID=UPI0023EB191E|nr:T9SS type A sorting domain-containing protein [Paraflavitalea sp. H1-2-19X]